MRCTALVAVLALLVVTAPGSAGVGDVVHVISPNPPAAGNFCSIGLAFDGTSLYFNRCNDPLIYEISPITGMMISSFNPGIAQNPNAMAFDAKRNGLWIGAQGCSGTGMPIHFWDFDDNSVTLMFTIPFGLINPGTGQSFLGFCFDDGLAYNENDPTTDADDEVWFSDDVNRNLGLFRPNGTLVVGFDATTVDPGLGSLSGLAVGGMNLYLANNGGGDVFRAQILPPVNMPGLLLLDQFASEDVREEDMACDPVTFAPTEVMWVRTTPQGNPANDLITAFEIEPGTCGIGGVEPGPSASIDIKPGSCPNPLNGKSNGVIPVAVLGSDTLDPAAVDLDSLRLCLGACSGNACGDDDVCIEPLTGPPGPGITIEDVATPFDGPQPDPEEPCDDLACHELEGDGIPDLQLKFRTKELVQALEGAMYQLVAGESLTLHVCGTLNGGTQTFCGSDCMRIVQAGGNLVAHSSNQFDVFLQASLPDVNGDAEGWTTLARDYIPGTEVTLTAPPVLQGGEFLYWTLQGVPQPAGVQTVDIVAPDGGGFFETATHAVAVYSNFCLGDLNGDESVDPTDLALLLGGWGANFGHPSDFDGDGQVNSADLASMLGNWGVCE